MGTSGFHDKPYDEGTLTKLNIFELYAQEWIPVFTSKPEPSYPEVHIFDFFCGPGTDSHGELGSPLRILRQLRDYQRRGMAGWRKVKIVAHFFDLNQTKVDQLGRLLEEDEWKIPNVEIDLRAIEFTAALKMFRSVLDNSRAAKLLIIDQFGVDGVTESVFKDLITFPTTDFIFFLSSSTLHRFRDHTAIKIKIDQVEDSYDVHRAAFSWFRKRAPESVFLGQFSILKRSNIYGLIFGSQHPKGILKFLTVAWRNDAIAGEANFDIEREDIDLDEPLLPMDELRPNKIRAFEAALETGIRNGSLLSEAALVRFCIEGGMTCQHSAPVIKRLKSENVIECEFRTPTVDNYYKPRMIALTRL